MDDPLGGTATGWPAYPGRRRRGEALENAIFTATLDQLAAVGYAALSMERVAAAARTGKASLYRRWPSKQELVVDALHHALPAVDDLPDHGSVREDVLELLRRMAGVINSPSGCAIQALLGEVDRDRAFVQAVHRQVIEPRKRKMLEVLRGAVERGEARPEAVSGLVAEVGPAMVIHQLLVNGPPVPDEVVVAIVDEVVVPLLRA